MLSRNAKQRLEKGDTLIEVLFAITIFSLIVVSALGLMNQGLATSQRSLEITLVRQQIDNQAEVIRMMHASYVEAYTSGTPVTDPGPALEYSKIIAFAQSAGLTSASKFGETTCAIPPVAGKAFITDTRKATFVGGVAATSTFAPADTFSQLTYSSTGVIDKSKGLWIEALRNGTPSVSAGYIDFHIRACWNAPGTAQPINLGTIVRLYEPRG